MVARIGSTILVLSLLASMFSSCGGNGSPTGTNGGGNTGSGGGGGGGGGTGSSGPSISLLAPSAVMVGVPLGQLNVLGQGFTQQSQVLVDGQPRPTFFVDSGTLQAEIDISLSASAGAHQFSVQSGSTVSNSSTYTVYAPKQGPFVMQAIPSFLVADLASDAPFVVAADVNSDGLSDIIIPGPEISNSPTLAILDGQADGTLAAAQYIQIPTAPSAMAVADVDGNGTLDLVLIASDDSSSTSVSIMLGDGQGSFQQPSVQQTFAAIYPGPAYLSDLDGDGKPDLVLALSQPYSLVWLKNTGGGFAAPVTLTPIASDNRSFAIADFNGDGRPDILYVFPGSNTTLESMHILTNQGNGSFNDQPAGGLNGVVGLANVLDFNLDGIPDVIVQEQLAGDPDILYSFAGNGDGSFTPVSSVSTPLGPIQLGVGDFNHDGFPDLAGSVGTEPSQVVYFFGNGHGAFIPQNVVGPEGQVAVGDFNGDGIPDLAVADRFNLVSLALGRTDRNFPSPWPLYPATSGELSTGDINGDGLPEIFVGGDSYHGFAGTVFQNEGNNSFQLAAYTADDTLFVADLTGKGVVDLVGATTNLQIWPNNLSLNFSSAPITSPESVLGPYAVADIDGDGHADIVEFGDVLYGNGAYQFTQVPLSGYFSAPFVIGDFNGDGKLDIANGTNVYLNTGNRTFQQLSSTLPLSDGALAAVGDFNQDGYDDVAINLPGDATVAVYFGKGDGTFYEAAVLDPGAYPGALVAADFNGDGIADLAVGLQFSQQACLLFSDGKGQFMRSFFASGVSTVAMSASDLNRDGKPDLVIGNVVRAVSLPDVNVVFHK